MKRTFSRLAVCLLAILMCAVAAADQFGNHPKVAKGAQTDQSAKATGTIDSIVAQVYDECSYIVTTTFHVTGTVDEGGGNDNVYLSIYDDGRLLTSHQFSVPVSTTVPFQDVAIIPPWGHVFPGVGVYLEDLPGQFPPLDRSDPFLAFPPLVGVCPVPAVSHNGLWLLAGLVMLAGLIGLGVFKYRRQAR